MKEDKKGGGNMILDEIKSRYNINDDVLLHDVSKLVDYKDLTFKDIDLILSLKPDVSEKVRVEVVDMNKHYMSVKDINNTFFKGNKGEEGARRLLNAFEKELYRPDSKLNKMTFIELGERQRWVYTLALIWFMKYKNQLEDEDRRKDVMPFEASQFKDLLYFV